MMGIKKAPIPYGPTLAIQEVAVNSGITLLAYTHRTRIGKPIGLVELDVAGAM